MKAVKSYIAKDALPYSTLKLEDIAIDYQHRSRSLNESEARQVIQDLMNVVKIFHESARPDASK